MFLFTGQWRRAGRSGRITRIEILLQVLVVIGVIGLIVVFVLPSISRIRRTPFRGKTIEFGWSQDLVSDEPTIRAGAVTILCEAMQDKDRAVR